MAAIQETQELLQFREVNCKNCYKCVRNCPVKAIRIRGHRAQIIAEECILCEKCTVVCPQNAKVELNQIPRIQEEIKKGTKLIASIHPAYLAKFQVPGFVRLADIMEKIGFYKAVETAMGAQRMVEEYKRVLEQREQKQMTISSACPVIVQLIQKKHPNLIPYLAPVASAMQTHGQMIKKEYPDAKVVYVSPCISSMAELSEEHNYVDYVITFRELNEWMEQEGLFIRGEHVQADRYLARAVALPDGISLALPPIFNQKKISVHGMENCLQILKELEEAPYDTYLIEMNACMNGCIGGPSFQKGQNRLMDSLASIRNASLSGGMPDYEKRYPLSGETADLDLSRTFSAPPEKTEKELSEEAIRKAMAQMGKFEPKDELNCGACGYNTCREKAIAILENKAEVSMCVPFMRERQESYSNKIMNTMPGHLVTVDYHLNVVHMNQAARDLFDIEHKKNMLGQPVSLFMDDYAMVNLISFDRSHVEDQIYLEKEKKYLERMMTNDRKNQLILCIMKDVTKEMEEKKKRHRSQLEALELADSLAEEQLKIVHQIAGLLGETAADTKVAVEKLKSTILQENPT